MEIGLIDRGEQGLREEKWKWEKRNDVSAVCILPLSLSNAEIEICQANYYDTNVQY